jgi:heptosyltransferase-3
MRRVLVVRLDSDGDVLLAGPAVRAVARQAQVSMLVSPAGRQAADLLPGVSEVIVCSCPWTGYQPPAVDGEELAGLVDLLRRKSFDAAVVLTSAHQSALPAALLLKLAGVGWVGAISEDYPGSLLDLRLRGFGGHEVERAVGVVSAAGFPPHPDDDLRLRLRRPLPDPRRAIRDLPPAPYLVVHPGASVPARAPGPEQAAELVRALSDKGWNVVVTGGPGETGLTAAVAGSCAVDLGGRTGLAELAGVLERASCLVSGNTGPAHLAAAVGTPVVSLFAPVVSAAMWAPWGVPVRVLGDQQAPCAGSRARTCPVPGHPCLTGIDPHEVVCAVEELAAPNRRRKRTGQRVRAGIRTPDRQGHGDRREVIR